MALFVGFHSRHEQDFIIRSAAQFAAMLFTSPVESSMLNGPTKAALIIAFFPDRHQFVLETPGGRVRNAQMALQGQLRVPIFLRRQEIHGEKPDRQRLFDPDGVDGEQLPDTGDRGHR